MVKKGIIVFVTVGIVSALGNQLYPSTTRNVVASEGAEDIYGAYVHYTDCDCLGDIDGNSQINLIDLDEMVDILVATGAPFIVTCDPGDCADMDSSGKITLVDLDAIVNILLDAGAPFIVPCGEAMDIVMVTIPGADFEISKYETTNAQYCEFLNAALASGDVVVDGSYVKGANGSNSGADFVEQVYYYLAGSGFTYNGATNGGAARINYSGSSFTVDSGFDNHPVTYVSWYGSTAFCNYYGYRLPTEWEWQAVADYNGSYTYGCGTSINNSIANYRNSTHPDGTTVVGSFGTYGYGMCDMAGNVWEWTDSIYSGSSRVFRGGCWGSYVHACTVSGWHSYDPGGTGNDVGFRAVLDLEN